MPFLKGIITGFLLTFLMGPTFFYLMRVSVLRDFRLAIGFAIGIVISDLCMIIPIFFGLRKVFQNEDFQAVFGIIATISMIFLSLKHLLKKGNKIISLEKKSENDNKDFWGFLFTGVSMNIINPFTIMLWLSLPGFVKIGTNNIDIIYFVTALGLMILIFDLLKAYLAGKLTKRLTPQRLVLVDKTLGIALLVFSIWYGYKTLLNYEKILAWFA